MQPTSFSIAQRDVMWGRLTLSPGVHPHFEEVKRVTPDGVGSSEQGQLLGGESLDSAVPRAYRLENTSHGLYSCISTCDMFALASFLHHNNPYVEWG